MKGTEKQIDFASTILNSVEEKAKEILTTEMEEDRDGTDCEALARNIRLGFTQDDAKEKIMAVDIIRAVDEGDFVKAGELFQTYAEKYLNSASALNGIFTEDRSVDAGRVIGFLKDYFYKVSK